MRANESGVSDLAFSPDGETLASVGRDDAEAGDLILWDATAWKQRGESHAANEGGVSAVSFSAKGDLLATGGTNAESHGTVIFWNAKTATPESPLDASESNVTSMAFSPDGSLLVTGGENRRGIGDVILWDVGKRQSLGPPLAAGNWPVACVAFRPDGNQFSTAVAGPRRSGLLLWEIGLSAWQTRAHKIANRNLSQKEWDQYLGPKVPYHKILW